MVVVIAAWKLKFDDFIKWNRKVFEANGVHLVIVVDRKFIHASHRLPWVHIVRYPYDLNPFSISKLVNYGIRKCLDEDIIIRSGVDIVFGDNVFEYIKAKVNDGTGFCGRCCYTNFEYGHDLIWDKSKVEDAVGGCLALTPKIWCKLCGYNENMSGWGWEDFDLLNRCKEKIKMIEDFDARLYHIKHRLRYFARNNNNEANKEIAKLGWNNKGWGL